MQSDVFWQMFLETGAPEMYLMYQSMKRTEQTDVLENPGTGTSGLGLQ